MITTQKELPTALRQRLEETIGQSLQHIQPIQRGYTAALRLVISLTNNTTVFAKIATNSLTATWLRNEYKIYKSLSKPFMAHCLAWDDDRLHPILVLEDLSQTYWPPPWTEQRINQVIETLAQVAATQITDLDLPALENDTSLSQGWPKVAQQPQPFLSLGLATEKWLEKTLPQLLQINHHQVVKGQALLHLDVRSDNICFQHNRMILVDWNWACRGNPLVDLGAWLPSLESEGGPPPDTILPAGGEIAALLSGYFASHAGLPPPPTAPHVRRVQLTQLQSAYN